MFILILLVPIIFLAWAAIHEISHYIVAKKYLNVTDVSFFLYPHSDKRLGFVWAKVKWSADRPATECELAHISFAPRIPDFIAVIAFMFWPLMTNSILMFAWAAFWAGGLIDLFVGSLGAGYHTDLKRISRGWDIAPWILRVGGISMILSSIIGSVLIYLL